MKKETIKESRIKAGLTQEELARLLNISLRYYQNIESYKSIPNVILGFKLSIILKQNIDLLWNIE